MSSRTLYFFIFPLILLLPVFVANAEKDHRAWQHGIEWIKHDERNFIIWSSWGNPPTTNPGKDWQHDIYQSWIEPCDPVSRPSLLVEGPEAQEPPSASLNNRGKVLLTWEDGRDGINQYAAFLDTDSQQVSKPFLIRSGGHSGHVAASRDKFLIAYSEDWIDADDGFLQRGTGKNLFARIIEGNGHMHAEIPISRGNIEKREDWPLVAGSERGWIIVWQRYPERTLHAATVDRSGVVGRHRRIAQGLRVGYHYDVQYLPALKIYFVLTSDDTGGAVVLLDMDGNIIRRHTGLPPFVSESRFVWTNAASGVIGVYPTIPSGIAVIHVSAEKIFLQKMLSSSHQWDYIGTTGSFVSDSRVLFATLSRTGLKFLSFDLEAPPVSPSNTCASISGPRR